MQAVKALLDAEELTHVVNFFFSLLSCRLL